MPELPEVQTTSSQLNTVLPRLKIKDVWADWPRQIRNMSVEELRSGLVGKTVLRVHRRGKNVLIEFKQGLTLLIHMKMTGHLMYGKWKNSGSLASNPNPEARLPNAIQKTNGHKKIVWKSKLGGAFDDPYNRFIHFLLHLSNGYDLAFCDTRKFGRIELIETKLLHENVSLSKLGPDAMSPELTPKRLQELLSKKPNSPIKPTLMNQTVVAGIGNIYADELLWLCGIHPLERIKNIPTKSFGVMHRAMQKIFAHSISVGGDSASDYRNIYGERGGFQHLHRAYRQTGKPCSKRNCKGVIKRIVIGQRSAHYCPEHQK